MASFLDHFSPVSQLRPAPHAPCATLYLVPMLIGWCSVLGIRWCDQRQFWLSFCHVLWWHFWAFLGIFGLQVARGTAHDRYLATAAAIQGLLSELRTANRGLDFVLYGGPVAMPPAHWYSGRPIGSGSDAENREIIQNQMDRPEVAAILDLVVVNCAEFYPNIDQHTPAHWRAAIASLAPLGTKAGFIIESQFESKPPDAAPAGWNISSRWAPVANRHGDGCALAETTSWLAITAGIMETIAALHVWVGGWVIPDNCSLGAGMFRSARPVSKSLVGGLPLPSTYTARTRSVAVV